MVGLADQQLTDEVEQVVVDAAGALEVWVVAVAVAALQNCHSDCWDDSGIAVV